MTLDFNNKANEILIQLDEERCRSEELEQFSDYLTKILQDKLEIVDITPDDIEWFRVYAFLLKKIENKEKGEDYCIKEGEWRNIGADIEKLKFVIEELEAARAIDHVDWFLGGAALYTILDTREFKRLIFRKGIHKLKDLGISPQKDSLSLESKKLKDKYHKGGEMQNYVDEIVEWLKGRKGIAIIIIFVFAVIYIGNFLQSAEIISSLLLNQDKEISPTSTLTPTPTVTPTSTSTVSPPSPTRPTTQPITVANAGSIALVQWAKPFGSPENIALSPDGKTLAVATAFNILVYDLGNLEAPLFELEGQKTLSKVMFSPDGQILASAGSSFDGTIWLWDMPKGGVKRAVLEGHTEAIYGIAFSPNGELLASGSRDNSVRVWDVKTGKELFFSLEHNGEVHSVAFSTDGATLASGGADGKIRLWDVESSQEKRVLDAHPIQVECLAFSPDGKLLASADQYDTAIRLWDTQTWQPMIILRGHVESAGYGVFSLAFNDQGTLLASGGGDKSIRLWDVNPVSPSFGKELVELQRHSDWVDSLVFSPDGVVLISASDRDGTIRIWEAGPESKIDI